MSDWVPGAEDAAILQATNLTGMEFGGMMFAAMDVTWIVAENSAWRKTIAYDLIVKIADFLNSAAVTNKTESVPQLAEYLGVEEYRVQYVYDIWPEWYGLGDFPTLIETMKNVFPQAGHPAHESNVFIGILVLFLVLTVIFVGARLYSRIVINGFIRGHDYVLLSGVVVAAGLNIMNAVLLSGPTHFRGNWDRSWQNAADSSASTVATSVLYGLGITLIKASLLLFYWGLTTWWPLRTATGIIGFIVFGNMFAQVLTSIFWCSSVLGGSTIAQYWESVCNRPFLILTHDICGGINIATDVAIWLIPLPMVWKVSQSMRERFAATLTFGLGALTCISCGFRFYANKKIQNSRDLIPQNQMEYLMWTMSEMFTAIICSCAPAIRALIIKKAPTVLGTSAVYTEDGKSDEKSDDIKKDVKVGVDDYSNRGSSPA